MTIKTDNTPKIVGKVDEVYGTNYSQHLLSHAGSELFYTVEQTVQFLRGVIPTMIDMSAGKWADVTNAAAYQAIITKEQTLIKAFKGFFTDLKALVEPALMLLLDDFNGLVISSKTFYFDPDDIDGMISMLTSLENKYGTTGNIANQAIFLNRNLLHQNLSELNQELFNVIVHNDRMAKTFGLWVEAIIQGTTDKAGALLPFTKLITALESIEAAAAEVTAPDTGVVTGGYENWVNSKNADYFNGEDLAQYKAFFVYPTVERTPEDAVADAPVAAAVQRVIDIRNTRDEALATTYNLTCNEPADGMGVCAVAPEGETGTYETLKACNDAIPTVCPLPEVTYYKINCAVEGGTGTCDVDTVGTDFADDPTCGGYDFTSCPAPAPTPTRSERKAEEARLAAEEKAKAEAELKAATQAEIATPIVEEKPEAIKPTINPTFPI